MATPKQRNAARRNIKKATAASSRKRSHAHDSSHPRPATGKEGAKPTQREHEENGDSQ
jgi:hypothetical protein